MIWEMKVGIILPEMNIEMYPVEPNLLWPLPFSLSVPESSSSSRSSQDLAIFFWDNIKKAIFGGLYVAFSIGFPIWPIFYPWSQHYCCMGCFVWMDIDCQEGWKMGNLFQSGRARLNSFHFLQRYGVIHETLLSIINIVRNSFIMQCQYQMEWYLFELNTIVLLYFYNIELWFNQLAYSKWLSTSILQMIINQHTPNNYQLTYSKKNIKMQYIKYHWIMMIKVFWFINSNYVNI